MATAKKTSSKSKKPAAKKAAPAKKSAPVKKSAAKVASKPAARPTPTHAAAAARAASIHLHAVPSKARKNAPTPKWIDQALANAQQNPAVSLVCMIAVAVGIFLILR